jgi:hypothetical protein
MGRALRATLGVVAAVLYATSALGDLLGQTEALAFLGIDRVRVLSFVGAAGLGVLWARSKGLLLSHQECMDSLRRTTRLRLQEQRGSPVTETEADEQVQRWEQFRAWLGRAIGRLRCHPEDVSHALHADVVGGLQSAQGPVDRPIADEFRKLLMHTHTDLTQTITKRTLRRARTYLRTVRCTVQPWELTTFKLARFDAPLRP